MSATISELEVQIGLCEDHIEQLNRTIFRQQQQLDLLQAQFRELYRLIHTDAASGQLNLRDEIPPHY